MCGVLDDLLPVLGGIGGFLIGGPGGAALGGALGGGISGYAQTHNILGTLEGAGMGGVSGYFGGGSLGQALENLGTAGVGAASQGFATDLASNVAPSTLGGLESTTGGAALFGPMAGTGTAIGGAAGALGGNGLGIAGGDALSGVSGAGSFLGGLGGGAQGTGLGVGGQASSVADLSGATNQGGELATPATSQGIAGTPVSTLSQTPTGGITPGSAAPTTSPMGSNVLEGSQAATVGSGAPMGYGGGASLEGSQAAVAPGGDQGALAAMYGPTSTSAGSTVGQGIAGTQGEVPEAGNVQFGALGEGTAAAPGIAGNAASAAGSTGVNFSDLQNLYSQVSPWMRLAQSGLGAYQQYAQQQAQQQYVNQINQEFATNSPYAQQMQQTLARQDAAAGRNSQYGNRAVQLAAALTQARAQALGNQNYYRAATATPGASMLNTLFANFASPQGIQAGQQLFNAGSAGLNSLAGLFGG